MEFIDVSAKTIEDAIAKGVDVYKRQALCDESTAETIVRYCDTNPCDKTA